MISPIRSLNVRSTAFPRVAPQMNVSQTGPAFACTTVDPCFRMTSRRHLAACARVRTTHEVDGSSSTWRLTHSSSASSHPGTVHSAVVVEFVSVVGQHHAVPLDVRQLHGPAQDRDDVRDAEQAQRRLRRADGAAEEDFGETHRAGGETAAAGADVRP